MNSKLLLYPSRDKKQLRGGLGLRTLATNNVIAGVRAYATREGGRELVKKGSMKQESALTR